MTTREESWYAINQEETEAPLAENYKATEDETKDTLDYQTQTADSTKPKESRCSTRTKFFSVGLLAAAVAAGSLGYYFGIYKKDVVKPKYKYKRVIVSSPENSTLTPISLSSTEDQCTVYQGSTTIGITPMPHQLILCQS